MPRVVKEVMTRLFSLMEAEYPAITPEPKPLMMPWIMMLPTEMKLCCKMLGMAMMAIFFRMGKEKNSPLPSWGMVASRRNTKISASTQLTPWHRKVAQATPATPIWKAVTKRISTAMLEVEEAARK